MNWIKLAFAAFLQAINVHDALFVNIVPCIWCGNPGPELDKLDSGWIVHCTDGDCRYRTAGAYPTRRQAKLAWKEQNGIAVC